MSLRLVHSNSSWPTSRPSTTQYARPTTACARSLRSRPSTLDRLWAKKLRQLRLEKPALAEMIESMTDQALGNANGGNGEDASVSDFTFNYKLSMITPGQ